MKLVSFYADVDGNTFYSENAKILEEQCKQLGIDYLITEQHFGNNWIDNVRAKPVFLLETLKKLNHDFVWLDCDCRVLKPLDFEVKSDWGVYLRDDGTPHDFVHYVSNTENSRNFIREWIKAVDEQQRGSHTAFISIFDQLNSEVLPQGYFELGLAETQSKQDYFEAN
jgi:hypothetical protein